MLLHHYLEAVAQIHKEADAKIKSLLSEITDPKIKKAVEEWEPGDPISHEYPQVDPQAKKEAPASVQGPVAEANHQPEPHEPATGNKPA